LVTKGRLQSESGVQPPGQSMSQFVTWVWCTFIFQCSVWARLPTKWMPSFSSLMWPLAPKPWWTPWLRTSTCRAKIFRYVL
jgi:hypothetical protein